MSERLSDQKPSSSSSSSSCLFLTTLFQSLLIFPRNKRTFFSIFALLTLPLSFLLFSLSFTSHPIKSQILHLEAIAAFSFTPFEARHVLKESRDTALSLLHLKLLYFLPSYPLSLLAAITTVVSADSAYHSKPFTLKAAFAVVKRTWTRPLATSICIYVILLLYSAVPYTLAIIAGPNPGSRLAIWVIGLIVEFHVLAVLGMGLVVSVVERRFGWDAIRFGSGLMEGRWLSGWFLSGLLGLVTGGIGGAMDSLMVMYGLDLVEESKWSAVMVMMKRWESFGLIGLYGVVVVWGFVVATVFYCECRRRHVVLREEVEVVDS